MADKFTNNTQGPKVVNTTTGAVTLAPGETLGDQYEVSAEDAAAMDKVGLLGKPGGDATADTATQPMGTGSTTGNEDDAGKLADSNSKDQLLEIARTEGVENVSDSNTKAEIAAAIVAARQA